MNNIDGNENLNMDRFIPYWPDKILDQLDTGAININAYNIYMYLRLRANPYGKVTTSFGDINKTLFNSKKDRSTINKYFLSLNAHNLLVYPIRKGKRENIIIHFTDFFDPKVKNKNGVYALVGDKYFTSSKFDISDSQVQNTIDSNNHTLQKHVDIVKKAIKGTDSTLKFTTPNNDNDKDKEKDTNTKRATDMTSLREIMEERKKKKSI
jgi:hypothetical protein